MSMYSINHCCTIPTAYIKAAGLDDLCLVWSEGEETGFSLVDFRHPSEGNFEFWGGEFITIDPDIRKNPALKEYSNRIIDDQRGDFAALVALIFPDLVKNRHDGPDDAEDLDDDCDDGYTAVMWDDFSDTIMGNSTGRSLTHYVAKKLKGVAGVMTVRTSDMNSQSLYGGNDVMLPSEYVDTTEEIDLKTGKVTKLTRELDASIDERFEFDDFDLFWSYFGKIENVSCQLVMHIEHDDTHAITTYLVSGVLEDPKTTDGDLIVSAGDEVIWQGSDSKALLRALNHILDERRASSMTP